MQNVNKNVSVGQSSFKDPQNKYLVKKNGAFMHQPPKQVWRLLWGWLSKRKSRSFVASSTVLNIQVPFQKAQLSFVGIIRKGCGASRCWPCWPFHSWTLVFHSSGRSRLWSWCVLLCSCWGALHPDSELLQLLKTSLDQKTLCVQWADLAKA